MFVRVDRFELLLSQVLDYIDLGFEALTLISTDVNKVPGIQMVSFFTFGPE